MAWPAARIDKLMHRLQQQASYPTLTKQEWQAMAVLSKHLWW
jgi:hypothetical protein